MYSTTRMQEVIVQVHVTSKSWLIMLGFMLLTILVKEQKIDPN